jgi:hypothetical protein
MREKKQMYHLLSDLVQHWGSEVETDFSSVDMRVDEHANEVTLIAKIQLPENRRVLLTTDGSAFKLEGGSAFKFPSKLACEVFGWSN